MSPAYSFRGLQNDSKLDFMKWVEGQSGNWVPQTGTEPVYDLTALCSAWETELSILLVLSFSPKKYW